MAHKSFQEYLDNKSKMSNTGKVQQIADYTGPKAAAPGKEKKHKDAGGEGQKGTPKPYAGGTNAADPNKGKLGDGFAKKGDKALEYTPGKKTPATKSNDPSGVPGGKSVATWPKTKTQEWIDRTKEMSLAEFTKAMQKHATKGLDECACQNGDVLESVKTAVALAKANTSVMNSLVREMKRSGTFGKLVAEMLKHEETYGVIARFMEHDEKYARRLVRAMNEMVGPPAHKDDIDEDDPSKPPHPSDHHGSDDDDPMSMGDDDMGDDMGMGGDDDDMGMGGDDDGMGGDDMGGDDMGMGGDDDGMGDPSMGPHGHGGDKDSDIAPGSKIMPTKKKKPKAHHHLMSALKDSPMGQDMGGMGGMGGGVGPV